jgi:DNA repair exonuclease SbcCD nuclease subunit
MNFQYFSDIHLEMYNEQEAKLNKLFARIKPIAPFLIMAGDIGYPSRKSYKNFLNYLSPLYKRIFITSGNHEYYQSCESVDATDMHIREIVSTFPNIIFLQCEVYDLSQDLPDTDLMIYGGTFWSDISPSEEHVITRSMRDYVHIKDFTVGLSRKYHKTAVAGLENALELHDNKRFIVISHHLPSYSLIHPRFISSGINSAFASEIPIANDTRIVAWVAGHTHETIQKGKFYVNSIGYKGERHHVDFEKQFTL